MRNKLIYILLLLASIFMPSIACAVVYDLSAGNYPPCSTWNGQWNVSGNTYTCNQAVTLSTGDSVIANANSVMIASGGFSIAASTIGTAGNKISLQSAWGPVSITGTTTINGDLTASSSNVTLNDTTVLGDVITGGTVNLITSNITGLVRSFNSTVTANNTNISGGIRADSNINVIGGIISGNIIVPNGGVTLNATTMVSGSINTGGSVNIINGSQVGSTGSTVSIQTAWAPITVNNATVFGDLTAPVWSTIFVQNGGAVYGNCVPGSTPVNACAAAPPPPPALVAEWRLDEASWDGSAGEVIDESGNGLHGRAVNLGSLPTTQSINAALTGNPGTCGTGEFNQSNGYVLIDDNASLDLAEFTVTAWVNASARPSSGLSTIVSKDENFEFHLNSARRINWWWQTSNGSRSITSSARLSLNTWHHIAIAFRNGSQVLYIDGVSSASSNSTRTPLQNNDGVIIGTDHNGGQISSRRFNGLIDEVRIYDGALTQSDVNAVRAERHTCLAQAVSYYGISHSGTGVTCEAEEIIITAYDTDDNVMSPLAGTEITVSTTPSTGVWSGGNSYTFTGAESSRSFYLQQTTPATLNINVSDGTVSEHSSLDSDIIFSNTGLKFYGAGGGLIPNQVAAVSYNNAQLRVIQTDNETGACVARVQGSATVALAYECRNPTACINTENLTINNANIARNNNGAGINFSNVTLNFNTAGLAQFNLEYSDVGQVQLHGSVALPALGVNPALTLIGTSNEFVVKPDSLVVAEARTNLGGTNPSGTTIASCNNIAAAQAGNFVKAGETFTLQVEARNADNNITPNYGNENSPEQVSVALNNVVYPAGGTLGVLASPTAFVKTGAGVFTNTTVSWSEVGAMTLVAEISGDNDYLTAGSANTVVESAVIGRFYPHDYVLNASSITPACSSFSYMSQPDVTVNYLLQARNVNGLQVSNYDESLGFSCAANITYVAENSDNGVNLGARVLAEPVTTSATLWTGGLWTISDSNAAFLRKSDGNIDGQFMNLMIGLSVNDPVFNASLLAEDMNTTTTGDCVTAGNCNAKQLGNVQDVRFGRIVLNNAYGPESLDLPVEFTAEYFNGVRWQKNTDDACTAVARGAIAYPAGTIDNSANQNIGIGTARGEYGNLNVSHVNFIAGDAEHYFSAAGFGNTGSFPVTVDLTTMPWLQFDWNADAILDATITRQFQMGAYRGHDRILYWREVLQ